MKLFKKGFTLIELLVVIAIIAILAGLLMPSLASAKSMARTAVDLGNLKQIGLAIHMYATAWGDSVPYAACCWPRTFDPTYPGEDPEAVGLRHCLEDYIGLSDKSWINPNAVCGIDENGDITHKQTEMVQSYVVYGYNYHLKHWGKEGRWPGDTFYVDKFSKLDGTPAGVGGGMDFWVRNSIRVDNPDEVDGTEDYVLPHLGGGGEPGKHILYADGHVGMERGHHGRPYKHEW